MKMSIRIKLLAAFLLVIALTIALGIFTLMQMNSINQNTIYLGSNSLPSIITIDEITYDINQYRTQQLQHLVANNTLDQQAREEKISEIAGQVEDAFKKYATLASDANDQDGAYLEKIQAQWKEYVTSSTPFLILSKTNNVGKAEVILDGKAYDNFVAMEGTLKEWKTYNNGRAQENVEKADNSYRLSLVFTISLIAVVALAGLALGFWISNSLSKAARLMMQTARQIATADIPALSSLASAIARGDLTQSASVQTNQIKFTSTDEMGELALTFNEMIIQLQGMGGAFIEMTHNLSDLVGQVSTNAAHLNTASDKLATAAGQAGRATTQMAITIQQIAQGINQQTDSISRTASSADQMGRAISNVAQGAQEQASAVTRASRITAQISTGIQQVANTAQASAQGAAQAAILARNGTQTVNETIQGMEKIDQYQRVPYTGSRWYSRYRTGIYAG